MYFSVRNPSSLLLDLFISHHFSFSCLFSFSPSLPNDFWLFTFCLPLTLFFFPLPLVKSFLFFFHIFFSCLSFTSLNCTSLLLELQFLVEHHLYRQQQGAGDECSSESCLSDRPSPDSVPTGEELPHDDEATAEAFEKLRCQMEGMFGDWRLTWKNRSIDIFKYK